MQEEDAIYPVAVLIDELRNEGLSYFYFSILITISRRSKSIKLVEKFAHNSARAWGGADTGRVDPVFNRYYL